MQLQKPIIHTDTHTRRHPYCRISSNKRERKTNNLCSFYRSNIRKRNHVINIEIYIYTTHTHKYVLNMYYWLKRTIFVNIVRSIYRITEIS